MISKQFKDKYTTSFRELMKPSGKAHIDFPERGVPTGANVL